MIVNNEFARLFKKYRLYSEIESLKEFGDILAAEGIIYENTIFTRWQKGQRYPHNRDVIIKIIEVFSKRGGIRTFEEANLLLESVKMRDLSDSERSNIQTYFSPLNIASLPEEPATFIGRDSILKEASWDLLKKQRVLFYGVPGTGKTATAIHLAHFLKEKFTDGIYWFRADIKPMETIIDELLKIFQKNPTLYTRLEEKVERLNEVLSMRNALIILDNVENRQEVHQVITNITGSMLVTSVHSINREARIHEIHMSVFTLEEYIELAERVLGKPYVQTHRKEIVKIGELLSFLPIISTITLRQIASDPLGLQDYLNIIQRRGLNYQNIQYDRKTLEQSFAFVLSRLKKDVQSLLLSCAVFMGSDMSIRALSAVYGQSEKITKNLVTKLLSLSLIEASVKNRYRLHPALKYYLLSNDKINGRVISALAYFEKEIAQFNNDDQKITKYLIVEFENVDGMMNYFYEAKDYANVIRCWKVIRNYLFTSGQWNYIKGIAKRVEKAYMESKDLAGLSYFYTEDLGRVYYFQNSDKVQIYARKGLDITKKNKDGRLIGLSEQKLAILAMESGKLIKSRNLLLRSNATFNNKQMFHELMFGYIYLGHVFKKLKLYKKSIECFYSIINNKNAPMDVTMMAHVSLGNVYIYTNNLPEAKRCFSYTYSMERKINHQVGMAMSLVGLGRVCLKENKVYEGYKYLHKAKEIFSRLQMKQKRNSIWADLMHID